MLFQKLQGVKKLHGDIDVEMKKLLLQQPLRRLVVPNQHVPSALAHHGLPPALDVGLSPFMPP